MAHLLVLQWSFFAPCFQQGVRRFRNPKRGRRQCKGSKSWVVSLVRGYRCEIKKGLGTVPHSNSLLSRNLCEWNHQRLTLCSICKRMRQKIKSQMLWTKRSSRCVMPFCAPPLFHNCPTSVWSFVCSGAMWPKPWGSMPWAVQWPFLICCPKAKAWRDWSVGTWRICEDAGMPWPRVWIPTVWPSWATSC